MFFPCARLHASRYYPLPFAVLQPVLMSTGHTPMYTSAVSTLVRAQWRMPPQKSAVSPPVITVCFCVPIYRLGWICRRSEFGPFFFFVITVCLVLFFLFCIICDAEVRRSSVVSVWLCSLSFKNSFVWQIYLSRVNIVSIAVKGCAHITHWMSGLDLHFCSQSIMNIWMLLL